MLHGAVNDGRLGERGEDGATFVPSRAVGRLRHRGEGAAVVEIERRPIPEELRWFRRGSPSRLPPPHWPDTPGVVPAAPPAFRPYLESAAVHDEPPLPRAVLGVARVVHHHRADVVLAEEVRLFERHRPSLEDEVGGEAPTVLADDEAEAAQRVQHLDSDGTDPRGQPVLQHRRGPHHPLTAVEQDAEGPVDDPEVRVQAKGGGEIGGTVARVPIEEVSVVEVGVARSRTGHRPRRLVDEKLVATGDHPRRPRRISGRLYGRGLVSRGYAGDEPYDRSRYARRGGLPWRCSIGRSRLPGR
jgi:hypothetical protein